MNAPAISIVMVDGGFRENFASLRYWLDQFMPAEQYELIWVDYTGTVAPEVAAMERVRTFALGRTDEPQILGYAYNEGIRQARGEVLVIPDADVACEADLLETVACEHERDPDLVLYVLRLDQRQARLRAGQDLDYLRRTCTIKHTFNYGGCLTVRRRWLLEMNGYEQLPFFAGYHYCGADNYIRCKNMGLKVRWHPTQRVYHPWHPLSPETRSATVGAQGRLIRRRAATWQWLAYDGLCPARNRPYDPEEELPGEWPRVMTERGVYTLPVAEPEPPASRPSVVSRARSVLRSYGPIRGAIRILGKALLRLSG